jgi:hypothetical protein
MRGGVLLHSCVTSNLRAVNAYTQPVGLVLQRYIALEESEGRIREQMQALQRKLVRVVTENEALRHVVDKLQYNVLSLRRQLATAGLAPEAELDDALLRPSPHKVSAILPIYLLRLFGGCCSLGLRRNSRGGCWVLLKYYQTF